MNVRIDPHPKHISDDYSITYIDRFVIGIPYGGKVIKWEVIFNAEDYTIGPDFVFGEEFLEDPDIDVIEKNIPSLCNWDANNSKSLLNVLQEFLSLYKTYHVRNYFAIK